MSKLREDERLIKQAITRHSVYARSALTALIVNSSGLLRSREDIVYEAFQYADLMMEKTQEYEEISRKHLRCLNQK